LALKHGKINFIGVAADSDTRSYKLEVQTPYDSRELVFGATAKAKLRKLPRAAYKINSSALALNDSGVVGIMLLDGDKFAFHPVEIIDDEADGLWIAMASTEAVQSQMTRNKLLYDGIGPDASAKTLTNDVDTTPNEVKVVTKGHGFLGTGQNTSDFRIKTDPS